MAHVLIGKPVSTFPVHATLRAEARLCRGGCLLGVPGAAVGYAFSRACAVVQPSLTTPAWPPIIALKPFLATSAGTTTLSPTLSLSCFLARLCQRPHLGTAMTRSRLHGGDDRAFPPLQASDPREVTVAPEVTVASTSGAGFVARAPRCRDDGSSPERAGETELPPPPLSD